MSNPFKRADFFDDIEVTFDIKVDVVASKRKMSFHEANQWQEAGPERGPRGLIFLYI